MLVRIGNTLFRWRNALFPVVFALLFAWVQPMPAGYLRTVLEAAGLILVLGGAGVRLAVAGVHYIKRAGAANRIQAGTLHTDGLFSAVRNPLYVGNILMGAGFLALLGNPVACFPGILVVILTYRAIVAAEEDYLFRTFDDAYARYFTSVPRWLPHPNTLLTAMAGTTFSWRRAVAMEYSTLGAVLLGLISLDMRDELRNSTDTPAEHLVGIALIIMLLAMLRTAKKSGVFR